MGRVLRVNETRGLLTIDNLIKIAMGEGIFNIKLMNGPIFGDSKRKNNANGGGFDDGAECFIIVDAGLLREATTTQRAL